MENQCSRKVSGMAVGEVAYCSDEAHYLCLSGAPNREVKYRTFLEDVEVFAAPNVNATLKLKRERLGYKLTYPTDSTGPRLRVVHEHPNNPLPVIGRDSHTKY
jgi:hypothetical protein